jgi:hypothetical protein
MNKDIPYIIGPAIAFIQMCYFLWKWRRIRNKEYSATGEIIGFDGTGDDAYLIIRFKTMTGESIEKKYKVGHAAKDKIGDQLPLYYDPDKPIDFILINPGMYVLRC